jgi:DNA polymerase-3 subunit epsilon
MGHMVALAAHVDHVVCATALEAGVRELRLIAEHQPKFNRRSRFPERVYWVKLTVEPWPRLSLVRQPIDDGADYIGPFSSKKLAERAVAALHETFPVRQCGGRLPRQPRSTACALAEMGRCLSPCDGSTTAESYAEVVRRLREALLASPEPVVGRLAQRMGRLAAGQRFEEAGRFRERLTAYVRGASRSQRLRAMTRCPEIVAARKADGRWEVHVIRHGRLAAAGVIPAGADASLWVGELQVTADTVVPGPGPLPASTAEEAELLLRWLESDGVRLVHVDGEWSCPVGGATRHLALHDAVEESRRTLTGV